MNTLKEITARLAHEAEGCPAVEAIMLVGSAAAEDNCFSDADFLALASPQNLELIRKWRSSIAEKLRGSDVNISGDALQFSADHMPISIACHSMKEINRIASLFSKGLLCQGERVVWAPCCRLPEGVCGDLAISKPVYDPRELWDRWRYLLHPYPERARLAILRYCSEEITIKGEQIINGRTNDPFGKLAGISDITVALLRAAFAHDRIYLRGLKHVSKIDRASFSARAVSYITQAEELCFIGTDSKLVGAIKNAISLLRRT